MKREEVEKGLAELVRAAKANIPLLSEIRVLGSYNNGNWNEEWSDIDIFVEIDDESSSFISSSHGKNYEEVPKIRAKLKENLSKDLAIRIDIDILNKSDVRRLWDKEYIPGKGPFGQNVKKGKLLYSTK